MKGGLATSAFSPAAFLNTRSGMLLFGQLDLILTIAFAETTYSHFATTDSDFPGKGGHSEFECRPRAPLTWAPGLRLLSQPNAR